MGKYAINKRLIGRMGITVVFIGLLIILVSARFSWAQDSPVRIGVLAKRGIVRCMEKWTPTADYLTDKISGKIFEIVPIDFNEVISFLDNKIVDFILVNPSIYVELENNYGVNRVATLKNLRLGGVYTEFGGAIFYSAKRTDIQHLSDIKGKSFMGVDEASLGGWRAAWREFKEKGIDPYNEFKELRFGGTQDAVVYAVKDGKVDAGTVRTDTLERMEMEGKIDLKDFRVIHEHGGGAVHLPFLHSTRSYPEWPFAKAKHTPNRLAEKVATALLEMPENSLAARAAKCAGWTIPLNYQSVHECLKELKVGPYKDLGKITPGDVFKRYWRWLIAVAFLFIVLLWITIFILKLNRNIRVSHVRLQKEMEKRKRAEDNIRESEKRYRTLVESSTDAILMCTKERKIVACNQAFVDLFGYGHEEIENKSIRIIHSSDESFSSFGEAAYSVVERDGYFRTELELMRKGGTVFPVETVISPTKSSDGTIQGFISIIRDITERKRAEEELAKSHAELKQIFSELKSTQKQMLQSEKMASVGQLAAGVAHEINNPTGFVSSNLKTLSDYQNDINGLIKQYRRLVKELKGTIVEKEIPSSIEKLMKEIIKIEDEIDIDFIMGDIEDLIKESKEGTERIKKIVLDLKDFAHPGEDKVQTTDINNGIESTLNVVWNELKYKATVTKDYGDLPPVKCYPQQLNQVFMNLLVNAAHAIEKQGEINISTLADNGHVEIKISDTGSGIPKEKLSKIFDPFFTTKEVGKGTGLGLNVAYNIINKHNGTIDVESEVGKGTEFVIRIPVE